MRSLGNRLQTVADTVATYAPFACLADIGSDHAYLAVYAMKEGLASLAVASDINEGPLSRGRETAARYKVSPEFVLSDGFDRLKGYTFDAACICGMGGELIADILARYGKHPGCRLFLQPMTAQDDLRKYLWENGYTITEERYTVERGKPYGIFCAVYTGENTVYSYEDLFLGKTRPITEAYLAYVQKVKAQCILRKKGLIACGMDDGNENLLSDTADKILAQSIV